MSIGDPTNQIGLAPFERQWLGGAGGGLDTVLGQQNRQYLEMVHQQRALHEKSYAQQMQEIYSRGIAGNVFNPPPEPTEWRLTGKVGDQYETLVTVNLKNGETTFGPNYNPDKAARAFWDAVVGMAPGRKK